VNNQYFILRHGQARSNKYDFVSSWPEKGYNPLTRDGKKQVKQVIKKLKRENIDLIFSSDVLRAKSTAEIIGKSLNLKINFDKRLREINTGDLNGSSIEKWYGYFGNSNRFEKRPPNGENLTDVFNRAKGFLDDIDNKYKEKNILIVSHGDLLVSFQGISKNLFAEKSFLIKGQKTGELRKL